DVALRAIFAHQRLRARHAGALAPRMGAVTFVQRFGGALSLSRRRVRAPAPPGDAGSAAARPPIPLRRGRGGARGVSAHELLDPCTIPLRPLYFCARGYVQVETSATQRTICGRPVRREEQRLAVGSDVSLYVAKRAVDRRAEIHGLRPGVIHRLARRHEQAVVPDSSPVREKEQLESVKANDCTLVVPRSIELRDQLRISKRSVSHSFAYVDV